MLCSEHLERARVAASQVLEQGGTATKTRRSLTASQPVNHLQIDSCQCRDEPLLWAKLRRQNTTTRIEQHIADPLGLQHDVSLQRPPGLSNAAADFLHGLDDFRMVGLAGIAQALGEIIRPDAVQIDAGYREDRIQVAEHRDVFEQRTQTPISRTTSGAFRTPTF